MTEVSAAGFLSYARSDDDREGGRIVRLAHLIRDEYETLTGATIDIFVDRDEIKWGANFRDELADALQKTTFFIPVLTPTYFLRDECRKEMRRFVSLANSLGLQDLLLSIRYTDVPDLREDSADELKAVAAGMQYEPWGDLRFVEEDSAPYRLGVNRLASRLVELTARLEQREPSFAPRAGAPGDGLTPNAATSSGSVPALVVLPEQDDDGPGTLELMADFLPASQEWTATIGGFPPALNRFNELMREATEKMERVSDKPNPFAAKMAVAHRLAGEIEPVVAELEQLSKRYSAGLLRIDPAVRAALSLAPMQINKEESRTAIAAIRTLVGTAREAAGSIGGSADAAQRQSGMSRDLRPIFRRFAASMRNIVDGQDIIEGWAQLADLADAALDLK